MGWADSAVPNPLPPDESRFWQLETVATVGFSIAFLTVSARLFTRTYLLRVADWSDMVLAFALVSKRSDSPGIS